MSPFPFFAPTCSSEPEKKAWAWGAFNQSKEPSWMSPEDSIRRNRVCNCIWANLTVGDMAARVAAVK